ncbi:hypothetical protein OPV22_020513 [Ensete ventricosum]|uniref:Homeobox domain-containing protein n=1 Tax=Ensete ventricosum TaxID=4639 RepID=A0AAV8QEK8_ENSVE|nr:hypothetical protein OPV22_020513 [Ensete ventricosum]
MDARNGSPNRSLTGAEPVRSRWTPKPEQILILESIFNSGMVNPPKDETVRIRKLLEKFGSVGDANVFYWFQNRRSRSRRRQRQLQAAGLAADPGAALHARQVGGAALYEPTSSGMSPNNSSGGVRLFACSSSASSSSSSSSSSSLVGDDGGADDLFFSRQMAVMESCQNPFMCYPDVGPMNYQPGTITVFINGIPSEVPRGPVDLRAMFGQNVMLVHSSGELLPINEYGILLQSLQMGESYFLSASETLHLGTTDLPSVLDLTIKLIERDHMFSPPSLFHQNSTSGNPPIRSGVARCDTAAGADRRFALCVDEAENRIFDAERYYNEGHDGISRTVILDGAAEKCKLSTHRRDSSLSSTDGYARHGRTRLFYSTPTGSSEASWNSQPGLLSHPPGSVAVAVSALPLKEPAKPPSFPARRLFGATAVLWEEVRRR